MQNEKKSKLLILCDIDRVLADAKEREESARKWVERTLFVTKSFLASTKYKRLYDELFYSTACFYDPDMVVKDTLIPSLSQLMALYGMLWTQDSFCYVTSRPEFLREVTTEWLGKHGLLFGEGEYNLRGRLLMKPVSSPEYIKTSVLKAMMAEIAVSVYQPEEVWLIDDDKEVCFSVGNVLTKYTYVAFSSIEECVNAARR